MGFGFRNPDSGIQISGSEFQVSGTYSSEVSGFGFRVPGFGIRISGSGFQVSGTCSSLTSGRDPLNECGLHFPNFFSGFGFRDSDFGIRISGSGSGTGFWGLEVSGTCNSLTSGREPVSEYGLHSPSTSAVASQSTLLPAGPISGQIDW